MKKIVFIIAGLLTLWACKRDRAELAAPLSKIAGIQDDWTLYKVVQYDEITQKELEVTTVYLGNDPMKINFSITGTDTIYSVIPGTSKNYFGTTGKWHFDNNDYPTKLIINNAGNDSYMPLLRTIREGDPSLEFKYTKVCSGRNVVSYKYFFKRS